LAAEVVVVTVALQPAAARRRKTILALALQPMAVRRQMTGHRALIAPVTLQLLVRIPQEPDPTHPGTTTNLTMPSRSTTTATATNSRSDHRHSRTFAVNISRNQTTSGHTTCPPTSGRRVVCPYACSHPTAAADPRDQRWCTRTRVPIPPPPPTHAANRGVAAHAVPPHPPRQ